ncbi:MAG: sigma-70 family RNA polymerase sigma factor [Thermomicrobiales bacterium]|nr:sigma-70 family RNA polymerase sigma factor [Thermomicrobiales bacterium]
MARVESAPGAQYVTERIRDDTALVNAARGDPDAFDALYTRFADQILNYCYYRLGRWDDAEDAAQQIFANVYAALPGFQDRGGSFRAWLFTIASHEVANRRRYQRRRPTRSPLDENYEDPRPTPEELAMVAERQERIRSLLKQLSEDQRCVLELRLAGLTDREIGDVLGRTPGAVRGVQARGVSRLRSLLGFRPTREDADHG